MNCIINYKGTSIFSTFSLFILFGISPNFASESTTEDHSHHRHMIKNSGKYTNNSRNYVVPDVTLVQSDGVKIPLKSLLNGDKTVILNFIFTSCTTICPVMSGTFAQVNSKILSKTDNLRMISISIDPEYDTPNRLEKYSEKFGANSNWIFLTGDLQDIISVQKAFNAYRGKKMNHTPATFIHIANKPTWMRLNGFASSDDIISELKKLSHNKL